MLCAVFDELGLTIFQQSALAAPIRSVEFSSQCRSSVVFPVPRKPLSKITGTLVFHLFLTDAFVKKIDPNPAFRIIHQSNLPFWTLLLQHA
jgi:hypothetical protein